MLLQDDETAFGSPHEALAERLRKSVMIPMCNFVTQASPYMPKVELPEYLGQGTPLYDDGSWQKVRWIGSDTCSCLADSCICTDACPACLAAVRGLQALPAMQQHQ
jgi:hypothetical protein